MVSFYSYSDASLIIKQKLRLFTLIIKQKNNILIDIYCSSIQIESEIINVDANTIKYNKTKTVLLPLTKQKFFLR